MPDRKSATAATAAEQQRYISVISQLAAEAGDTNRYGDLVGYHARHHEFQIHPQVSAIGLQKFLPWHRLFLLRAEEMGRTIDPLFYVPYWDWRVQREVPPWIANFKPTVKFPGDDRPTTRNPPTPGLTLPTSGAVDGVMMATDYTDYSGRIDLPHGRVHNWCNGIMGSITYSPVDPIFWLHHAMIDKLWAEWQAQHPGQNPVLTGNNRILRPWTERAADVLDIATLGYQYI